MSFPGGKGSTCQCRSRRFHPWVRKITWRRKWQSNPVFLPGKSHGQRSLVLYSPWGCGKVGHDLAAKQQYASSEISLTETYMQGRRQPPKPSCQLLLNDYRSIPLPPDILVKQCNIIIKDTNKV